MGPASDGLTDRRRTAWHEAAHAVAAVHLFGADAVDYVSLRPGQSFRGVTHLNEGGPRSDDSLVERDWRERKVIVRLAGDIAAMFAMPTTGYIEESPDELAAVSAAAALARLPVAGQSALLAAEEDEDAQDDDSIAYGLALTLGDYDHRCAALTVALLRVRAEMFVVRHAHAIRAVAETLLNRVVLPGPEAAAIVRSSRCACHSRTPPDEGDPNLHALAAPGVLP